jgi:hypothetical protein
MSNNTTSSTSGASLLNRFLALPRAIQWAGLGAVGLLLFLIWDSYLKDLADDINLQSEQILSQVAEVRGARDTAVALTKPELKPVVEAIGAVARPRSETVGAGAFTDVVNDLVRTHGISDHSFSLRARGKLPKNALVGALPAGKRAERMTADLKFSAKPEVALAVLADLESSPDIEQVSSVRLVRDANGRIKAHYVLEAWVISSDAPGIGSASASGAAL